MGRVPIWKPPDMTHKILLGKAKKFSKIVGQRAEDTCEWAERPFERKQSMRGSLVLEEN
jgi:hypothetical protein